MPDYDIAGSQLEGLAKTEVRLEKDAYNLQSKEDESIEVSYSILSVEQQQGTNDDILQKIATTINVQLTLESNERLPFIPFANFDTAKYADKLFLYGPSGCGKSRAIF